MSQISRLRDTEIENGNSVDAEYFDAEFNQLVAESNAQDTRITAIENFDSVANTWTETQTFSNATDPIKTDKICERTSGAGVTIDSVVCKDGIVKSTGTTPPSVGYISANASGLQYHDGNGVKTAFVPELSTPSIGQTLIFDGTNWVNGATGYILLRDEKSQNTTGGTFTSGDWRTRTLNTEVLDEGGHCTLSSNQFTLSAGTYRINAVLPVYGVDNHQGRLYNITDGSVTLLGQSAYSSQYYYGGGHAHIQGQFTISASKTFEIQHRCSASGSFGSACNFTTEIYTVVGIEKVA